MQTTTIATAYGKATIYLPETAVDQHLLESAAFGECPAVAVGDNEDQYQYAPLRWQHSHEGICKAVAYCDGRAIIIESVYLAEPLQGRVGPMYRLVDRSRTPIDAEGGGWMDHAVITDGQMAAHGWPQRDPYAESRAEFGDPRTAVHPSRQ